MADQTFRIRVVIDPKPTGEGLKKVEKRLDKTNVAANRLRATMARLLVSFVAIAALRATIRVIADFEQSMATIAAVTNATAREMALMSQTAQELGRTTRFTASEAADALVLLSRAGFDVAESTAAVASTLQLAQAAGIGLTSATDILASSLRGFRLQASEGGRVADVLAVASARANTTVLDLGQGMKFVAPISAGLSVSLETTAAAMGVLSDSGLQASLAGTGLRRVLAELESPTSATVKIFDQLGISTDEVKVSQVGLVEALTKLRDAGLDTGTALKVFGKRGGPAFEVLSSNIPKIQDLTEELGNAEGAAEKMAGTMDDTLQGAAARSVSAIKGFILGLDETFNIAESLTTTLDFLSRSINGVNEAFAGGVLEAAKIEATMGKVSNAVSRLVKDIALLEEVGKRQGFLSKGQLGRLEQLRASLAKLRVDVREGADAVREAAQVEADAARDRALAADKAAESLAIANDPLAKQLKLLREQNDVLQVAIDKGAEAALVRQIELDLLNKKVQLTPLEREELVKLIALNEALNKTLEKQQEITKVDVGFDEERVRAQVSSLLLQVGAASELELQITELNRVFAEGTIDLETYGRALDLLTLRSLNASQTLEDGFKRAFLKIKLEAEDLAAVGEQLVNVFADGATDALAELARTGKIEIKDLANSILDDLARILARLLVIQAISLFASGGATDPNFIGPLLSQREHGGPVMANRAFLVGEAGPELFVPRTDGMIVPADRTADFSGRQGGGMTVVQAAAPEVNLTINNVSNPDEVNTSLASGENDREILNILSRNRGKAKQILA